MLAPSKIVWLSPTDCRQHFERLQVAYRNSRRATQINTLLDFSRLETGRMQACYEPIDMANFTTELASVFRSTIERAGLKCNPTTNLRAGVFGPRDVGKIVFNLLSNAFKFTFAGEIEVSLRAVNKTAELTVRDTGTGIPPQDLRICSSVSIASERVRKQLRGRHRSCISPGTHETARRYSSRRKRTKTRQAYIYCRGSLGRSIFRLTA
jgi:signal transduction histidine kinase